MAGNGRLISRNDATGATGDLISCGAADLGATAAMELRGVLRTAVGRSQVEFGNEGEP